MVRAEKVCDEGKQWQVIQHLRQVFRANDYPEPVVKNNLKGRTTPTNTTMKSQTPPMILHLPYVKGVSERTEKMYRPLRVRTVIKLTGTLRSPPVKVKQARPDRKKKGVVYEVLCKDCLCVYIGKTGRTLERSN